MRNFIQLVFAACLGIVLSGLPSYAQSKIVLHSMFAPGESLRFEIKTLISYQADLFNGYTVVPPVVPCEYSLSLNVTLNAGSASGDGNLPIAAQYENIRVTDWNCPRLRQKKLENELNQFQAAPVIYQIGPHGEPGFAHNTRDHFSYRSAQDLIGKITLDLLETHLSDRPVAPGDSWKTRGQFIYWKDDLLNGLDLSSSRMLWKASPALSGREYDLINSRYVFSPTDDSPNPITQDGTVWQPQSQMLSGALNVSLLFDPRSSHIVWLDRNYVVENHVSIQPVAEPDPEILRIRWTEEARARLLPTQNGIEWLAALKRFETTPLATQSPIAPAPPHPSVPSDLAAAALAARPATTPELNTLYATPKGFSRWEHRFCNGGWYCARLSIALPGEVKLADDAPRMTTYLARSAQQTFVVTLGPVLSRKYQGLTTEEELSKHTDFYLANQLWMENQPGIAINSDSLSVDGYSGQITTFRGTRRDLSEVQGELLILLSPWGDSYPVTCSAKQGDFSSVRETCTRVLSLVHIQRVE